MSTVLGLDAGSCTPMEIQLRQSVDAGLVPAPAAFAAQLGASQGFWSSAPDCSLSVTGAPFVAGASSVRRWFRACEGPASLTATAPDLLDGVLDVNASGPAVCGVVPTDGGTRGPLNAQVGCSCSSGALGALALATLLLRRASGRRA